MIKLVVCIPTAGTTPYEFSQCFTNMLNRLRVDGIGQKLDVNIVSAVSTNWISNREQIASAALDTGATHLLWLDDDMMFHPDVARMLFSRNRDIVLTNYLVKTVPATKFTSFGLSNENVITHAGSTGLEEVAFGGFGVALIKADVFRRVEQPWFLPRYEPEAKSFSTEDVAFFEKARAAGYKVWVDHDVSKRVGHIGRKIWFYNEYIDLAELDEPQAAGAAP